MAAMPAGVSRGEALLLWAEPAMTWNRTTTEQKAAVLLCMRYTLLDAMRLIVRDGYRNAEASRNRFDLSPQPAG
jgi:hypothetical protein